MLCYTGISYSRLYLNAKDKRAAWKALVREHEWWSSLSDFRNGYRALFENWDNPDFWHEADAFLDGHY